MSFLYNLRVVPICHLLQKVSTITSSPANVQCVHQFQTASTVFNKTAVVTNLCEKFCCAENVAKQIYDKFPSLRSLDAIKQDSLHLLREKVPLQSIVENPVLVTINISMKVEISLYHFKPFIPFLSLFRWFTTKDWFIVYSGTEKSRRFFTVANIKGKCSD